MLKLSKLFKPSKKFKEKEELNLRIANLESRVWELEKVIDALRGNVKVQKQQIEVNKTAKWLRGYPGDSTQKQEEA